MAVSSISGISGTTSQSLDIAQLLRSISQNQTEMATKLVSLSVEEMTRTVKGASVAQAAKTLGLGGVIDVKG